MVFKDIPLIRIGTLMLNFWGADWGHPANFIPFKTIFPYLLGYKGWLIAGINLIGNIALLVPIGLLLSFVFRKITWKRSALIWVIAGLGIEILQTILHVGIFDIDDVILNALGVIIGYGINLIISKWIRKKKYIHIAIATIISLVAIRSAFYAIYPYGEPIINQRDVSDYNNNISNGDEEGKVPQKGDLCNGTNGAGQIDSIGNNSFTIKNRSGTSQIINLINQATIKNSNGSLTMTGLKIWDRVTLVWDWNADGSFTANTILVCWVSAIKVH